MEERHDAVVALIAESHERRRLALLQAAALVNLPFTIEQAVTRAEQLLTEIEKREPPEAKP